MRGILPFAKYVIYVLFSSFDIYQDNGKLLTNFWRSSLLMKNVITKWISANVLLLLISLRTSSFQKPKQQTSSVLPQHLRVSAGTLHKINIKCPWSAQLKLSGLPQSITNQGGSYWGGMGWWGGQFLNQERSSSFSFK